MDLTNLFTADGLLAPDPEGRGMRRPRAQIRLSGNEEGWVALAAMEVAARIGYECEEGDAAQVVVREADSPATEGVPVLIRTWDEMAPLVEPLLTSSPRPDTGLVAVVPGLVGAPVGLLITGREPAAVWRAAVWLATLAPGDPGLVREGVASAVPDLASGTTLMQVEPGNVQALLDAPRTGAVSEPAWAAAELRPLDRLWYPGELLGSTAGLWPDDVRLAFRWEGGFPHAEELPGLAMFAFRVGLEATGLTFPLTAGGDRPVAVRLAEGDAAPQALGQARITWQQRGGRRMLTVTGPPAARGEALAWLSRTHASERLRPLQATWPALDTAAVALEREEAHRFNRRMAGLEPDLTVRWEMGGSESERFAQVWSNQCLPALQESLHPGEEVWIDLRMDQPQEVLLRLEREMAAAVARLGVPPAGLHVRTLPAFRQGFHWLRQVVPAAVQRHPQAHSVQIGYAVLAPASVEEVETGGPSRVDVPIRWLQELYPVDEILAAATGIAAERITFHPMPESGPAGGPTYRVSLLDGRGMTLWQDELTLAVRERPYQDQHPHLGTVQVNTGWCRISCGRGSQRREVVTVFLPTAAERFWDRYQAEFLPELAHRIEAVGGAAGVRADAQPFFLSAEVEVWLDTAPDQPLGIRQESQSVAEGLHEDIYFNTLDFFREWGQRQTGVPFLSPGKVVPRIHVTPQQGTRAEIRVTGLGVGRDLPRRPQVGLVLPEPRTEERGLGESRVEKSKHEQPGPDQVGEEDWGAPRTLAVTVSAGGAAVAHVVRPDGAAETISYVEAIRRVLSAVGLNPDGLGPFGPEPGTGPGGKEVGNGAEPRVLGVVEVGHRVQELAAHPGLWVSVVSHSFEGRPVYQITNRLWNPDTIVVPAKASLVRPTLIIKARHHANEVSSTNAVLELVRSHGPRLLGVNLVIVPLENPDGAELHRDLNAEHPTWSHHSARYNALGLEYALEYFADRRLSPEAAAYPYLWGRWLPDVVVDDHGVPSHEWFQPFGGHGGGRTFASYWLPRALIYGILPVLREEDWPRHARIQDAFARHVAAGVVAVPPVQEANGQWLAVYRKYASDRLPEVFTLERTADLIFYRWPMKREAQGRYALQRHPEITGVELVSEVADETAQGAYLRSCLEAHLTMDLAVLDWLQGTAAPPTEQVSVPASGGLCRRRVRRRPWDAGG